MPGSKYWKKRMLDIENQKNQMSIEFIQAAEKQFNIAKKNIEKDLARWYTRLADNNDISLAEAKKLLDKKELEEFKWTVDEYIKKGELIKYHPEWEQKLENASARVHISRLEAIKLQLQQETELLYGRFNEDINKHLKGIYENGYYRTAFEIQKGYGIGYSLHQLDSRKIDVALRTAWAQDGSNFSNRIWQQKKKLVNELNTVLVQNVIRGKDIEKSITDMAKKLDVSKISAGRLVMTESAAIHAKSQHECFKELDVEEFEFVATLDMKTSEICREMDGKHFKMSEYEIGITVPPLHPWCRSVTVPYFSDNFEDEMGKRAARGENGKTYYVPADMTYPEWKDKYINKNITEGNKITYKIDNGIRTQEELSGAAKTINNLLDSIIPETKSAWNGMAILAGKDGISSAPPDGTIIITENATDLSVLHELLHTRSYLPLGYDSFIKCGRIEEASVELFAEEIARKNNFFTGKVREDAQALITINEYVKIADNNYDFAYELFKIDLYDRTQWLIQKVNGADLTEEQFDEIWSLISKFDFIGEQ